MPSQPLIKHPLYSWEGFHGFIRHWFITGFFESPVIEDGSPDFFDPKRTEHWDTDHLAPWGGEAQSVPSIDQDFQGENLLWLPIQGDEFEQQLSLTEARHNCSALDTVLPKNPQHPGEWYALCLLESESKQAVDLKFSVHDGTRLRLNGEVVYDKRQWCRAIYDEISLSIPLKKGKNCLLFKQDRAQMVARIVDDQGNAPSGLWQLGGDDKPVRMASAVYAMKRHANALSVEKPFNGETPESLKVWQNEFRPHYEASFGKTPPTMVINKRTITHIDSVPCQGYTRHTLRLPAEANTDFECSILVPEESKRNGKTVITPHGHVKLHNHIIGKDAAPYPRWDNLGHCDANYNECLAQAGFVTAAFSQRGFDDRNDSSDGHSCNHLARIAQVMGLRLPRLHIEDILRVADVLATFDEVEGDNLGLAGLSGGATISWITGAYCDRFTAIAPFCGTMRATHWINSGGCGMQALHDVFPLGDTGEILSLIAPRALLLGQGRLDPTFNVIQTSSIYKDAKRAWEAAGVPEKLEYVVFEGGHQFHVPTAIRFFETHL